MFRQAHIIQSRPPRPLDPPLHNLNPLHQRTIDLIPHLDANPRQLVPQQYRSIDALPPDVEADAREGVAGFQAHEQDVADFGGFGIGAGEESGAGAGGIEDGELMLGEEGCERGLAG